MSVLSSLTQDRDEGPRLQPCRAGSEPHFRARLSSWWVTAPQAEYCSHLLSQGLLTCTAFALRATQGASEAKVKSRLLRDLTLNTLETGAPVLGSAMSLAPRSRPDTQADLSPPAYPVHQVECQWPRGQPDEQTGVTSTPRKPDDPGTRHF